VVGRVFVRGADLWDGHVVQQATDHEAAAGPIGLRVTRTYTSAGRGAAGLVGAGWSFSWQLTLTRHADWLFVVRLSDGNSLAFRRRKDGTFEPPPGYHSRLVGNPDGSFDFYDLAGYRYRFERPLDPRDPSGKLRLEAIVSPQAGRALLRYDARGRLARVSEETAEGRELWRLAFGYTRAGGFERLAWVRDRRGRMEVRYGYDAFGNLVSVDREGPKGRAPSWRYAYTVDDPRDRHQIVSAEGPDGKASYVYYSDSDAFEGEGPRELGLQLFGKGEYVREAAYAGAGRVETTRYAYDYSEWKDGVFRTRVSSAEGVTLYVLDARGRLVEMRDEPSPAKAPPSKEQRPALAQARLLAERR
jgi:YD repeat-containing protein